MRTTRMSLAIVCGAQLALAFSGCASSSEKQMRLQLRSWSGPPPRIGLQVLSRMAALPAERNDEQSLRWTQHCRDSLGRYAYIVDPSSPIQVTFIVLSQETSPDKVSGAPTKMVRRQIKSATRGVLDEGETRGTNLERLCPMAAQEGINAYAAEMLASGAAQPAAYGQPPAYGQPAAYGQPPVAAQPVAPAPAAAPPPAADAPPPAAERQFDAAGGKRQVQAADAYLAAGDVPRALEHYLAAYDKLPLPDLLAKIAKCYRTLGRRAEATKYFEQYVAIEPNGPAANEARQWLRANKR